MWTVLSLLSLAYWVLAGVGTVLTLRGVRRVATRNALATRETAELPTLSVVIAARNEAEHIETALRSRLRDPYPKLQLVFVDDRSNDGTGELARALAREDQRLEVVRIDELPTGWLGKVHALERGLARATGEWVLFSDADVRFDPGTLAGIVAQAERDRIDHVSVLPLLTARGPLLVPALLAFVRVFTLGGRLWAVEDAKSSAAVGIGAFNLVRRTALAKTPGFEWLRMEVADDLGLGVMLDRAGARSVVLNASACVSLDFYPSYAAMARSMEKNGASTPFPILVAVNVLLLFLESAFLLGPAPVLALGALLAVLTSAALGRWLRFPLWPALFPPFGMLLLTGAMLRSALLALWRGGVVWRGTLYKTKAVREGTRVGAIPSKADTKRSSALET